MTPNEIRQRQEALSLSNLSDARLERNLDLVQQQIKTAFRDGHTKSLITLQRWEEVYIHERARRI